jgi:hypothetical protein
MVENKWSSFAWDFKRRQLTIYAPSNKTGRWDPYYKVADLLNAAIRRCIETFFDGWEADCDKWATVYKSNSQLVEPFKNM